MLLQQTSLLLRTGWLWQNPTAQAGEGAVALVTASTAIPRPVAPPPMVVKFPLLLNLSNPLENLLFQILLNGLIVIYYRKNKTN